MGRSRNEIKAKLLAAYESQLDKGLEEAEGVTTLTEIEEIALSIRGEVGQQVTSALLERRGGQRLPDPTCERCGQSMRYKGQKARYMRTRSGDVELERAYYYCPTCREGLFPPG